MDMYVAKRYYEDKMTDPFFVVEDIGSEVLVVLEVACFVVALRLCMYVCMYGL